MSANIYSRDSKASEKSLKGLRVGFLAVGSATNSRSMFAGIVADFPAGNSVAILSSDADFSNLSLMSCLNSTSYDFALRNRLGGLNLNYFIVAETALVKRNSVLTNELAKLGARLCLPNKAFANKWLPMSTDKVSWQSLFALSHHERLRLKSINDALCAYGLGLDFGDLADILEGSDFPVESFSKGKAKDLNPKGFWRMDKNEDPELRQTVLSLIAFQNLVESGVEQFISQNDGQGWLIPETLRLADYGLGHDDRALEHQPVASRLGPRFYDWQLNEDVERSWEECAAHAELIRQIVPLPEDNDEVAEPAAEYAVENPQGALF
jgi:hypothetical protein